MSISPGIELETPLNVATSPRLSLIAFAGTESERRIPCRHIVTLLGSRSGCKVVLQNRRVDPVHLALVQTGQEVIAVDLVTKHGSELNGLKLLCERVSSGDMLTVGPWTFQLQIEESEDAEPVDSQPFGLDPAPHVIALEHLSSRRVLRPVREVCIIGRRSGCDVALDDHTLSRVHALLFTYHGHPVIVDLLSRNHTVVNDEPVSFRFLRNEDLLTLGETRFRVRLLGSGTSERAVKVAKSSDPSLKPAPAPVNPKDLVDIQATEGSQTWHIAEHLEKAGRKG